MDSKSFRGQLLATTSRAAALLGLPRKLIPKSPSNDVTVNDTVGKRGTPCRSYIRYVRRGPFYRQTGWKPVMQDGAPLKYLPRTEEVYEHRFLHATKGWRVFSRVPGIVIRAAMAQKGL